MGTYSQKSRRDFAYARSPDQDRPVAEPARHPVVIVGAGPVGLSLAIDLRQRGVPAIVLDDSDRIGEGSRAICFAKKTLEAFDKLGVGEAVTRAGVEWKLGRVFRGEEELYSFDLLPEEGHRRPAFVNVPQFTVESLLVDRLLELAPDAIRWRNRVTALEPREDGVHFTVETPDGPYALDAAWLVACDGARSPLRGMMGLEFAGERFDDQFLIADVRMTAPFPTERWFWFDPPFHSGRSALLHKQPDDVWRIDLQLTPDADAEAEKRPEAVRPRIARMLGHDDFAIEWLSIYRFQCRRLARFVHGRVVFAGDAAHQVSPFGARGANSGVQDAENLGWKLALVLAGAAPTSLIDTYDIERGEAADDNILNSTRATDFMAPRSPGEALLREAALDLAARVPALRRFVNSGRLSTPTPYTASPLSTPEEPGADRARAGRGQGARDGAETGPDAQPGPAGGHGARPGAPAPDAPLGAGGFLLDARGPGFALVLAGNGADGIALPDGSEPAADLEARLAPHVAPLPVRVIALDPARDRLACERLRLSPGGAGLLRPDGVIAARLPPGPDLAGRARRALLRAAGRGAEADAPDAGNLTVREAAE